MDRGGCAASVQLLAQHMDTINPYDDKTYILTPTILSWLEILPKDAREMKDKKKPTNIEDAREQNEKKKQTTMLVKL